MTTVTTKDAAASSSRPDHRVVVLGAGPAGLSVAERLTQRGVTTTVVDGAPGVGGLARSISLWDQRVDLGPHSFYSTGHPDSVRRWLDLAHGRVDRTEPRRAAVWHGAVVPFPPSVRQAIRLTGPVRAGRIALDRVRARLRRSGDSPADARSAWTAEHGEALVEEIFAPYTRKYLGLDPTDVDADFARLLLGARTEGQTVELLTPTAGSGSIWDEAAARVRTQGGEVRLGQPASQLLVEGDRVVGVGLRDGTQLAADRVVSTLPPHILLRCLPPVGDEAVAAAGRLSARNTILVYLRVEDDDVSPWHYVTVYDESLSLGRVTNVKVWRPGAFPAGSGTILCAELWTGGDTEIDALDDDALGALAKAELDQVGLVPASSVTDHVVVRLPRSVPVLRRGVGDEMRTLRAAFSRFEGLEVIGRHGTHAWDGQEDALVQGALLADRIADEIACLTAGQTAAQTVQARS